MAKVDLSNEVHALEIYRDQMRKELESAAEWKKNWGFMTESTPAAPRGFQQISVKYSAAGAYTNAKVSARLLLQTRPLLATRGPSTAAQRVGVILRRTCDCPSQKRVPDNSEEGTAAAMSEQKSRDILSSLDWQVRPPRELLLRVLFVAC
jgi:hypothetical protein